MTSQTKSQAHTAECRKVLDPSNCTCHVTAYLDSHPYACTNHQLAWHWTHQIGCEEFDAELDATVGFTSLTEDEAAAESRRFKIGRDAKVMALSTDLIAAQRDAKMWRVRAQVFSMVTIGWMTAAIGGFAGWW